MNVRDAAEEDVGWMLKELEEFGKFFGSTVIVFEPEYAREFLPIFIRDHLCLVAVDDSGAPYGFLGAFVNPHPYSPKVCTVAEAFFWVKKERRGGRAAVMLMDEYVKRARESDVRPMLVTMSKLSNSPLSPESLEKRGFHKHEESYIMELV